MQMLDSKQEEKEVEVLEQDQDRINEFSRLNQRVDEVDEELAGLKQELEDLEEMETELELLDEDEKVMYKIDTTFVHLEAPKALETLQGSLSSLKATSERLRRERVECQDAMESLKKVLYAKFGDTINLERGD